MFKQNCFYNKHTSIYVSEKKRNFRCMFTIGPPPVSMFCLKGFCQSTDVQFLGAFIEKRTFY